MNVSVVTLHILQTICEKILTKKEILTDLAATGYRRLNPLILIVRTGDSGRSCSGSGIKATDVFVVPPLMDGGGALALPDSTRVLKFDVPGTPMLQG